MRSAVRERDLTAKALAAIFACRPYAVVSTCTMARLRAAVARIITRGAISTLRQLGRFFYKRTWPNFRLTP
jgi:hypothetical protein